MTVLLCCARSSHLSGRCVPASVFPHNTHSQQHQRACLSYSSFLATRTRETLWTRDYIVVIAHSCIVPPSSASQDTFSVRIAGHGSKRPARRENLLFREQNLEISIAITLPQNAGEHSHPEPCTVKIALSAASRQAPCAQIVRQSIQRSALIRR